MGELRLFSISIDEARDMFAASTEITERLRATSEHLFPPAPQKRGLLDKLGPLLKKSALPAPDIPLPTDVDHLLAGRFVTPDRIPAAWVLVEHWLKELSWGDFSMSITQTEMDSWDFDLVRAGASSSYCIGKLFNEELGFPLRPLADQRTGYVRNGHVLNATTALTLLMEQLVEDSAERTKTLLDWFQKYSDWGLAASEANRPAPDLVGLFTL